MKDAVTTSPPAVKRIATIGGRFLTVGAISTLIEIASFNALIYVFGVDVILAKVIASLIALVNAYFGSALWTFRGRSTRSKRGEIGRFLIANAACAFLGATLLGIELALLTYRAGLSGPLWVNLANAVAIGVVVVVRFVLYSAWVFPGHTRAPMSASLPEVVRTTTVRDVWILLGVVAALAFTLYFGTLNSFVDEDDNILGGWLMLNRGELPYTGFFSHHMPLAYFVAAPIVALVGTNLLLIRVVFLCLMFAWLLVISRVLHRSVGTLAATVFVAAMTLMQLGVWSNLLLAETLVAYAAAHAGALLGAEFTYRRRRVRLRDVAVLSLLAAVPPLASLSYTTVSVVIYIWLAVLLVVRRRRGWADGRDRARWGAIAVGTLAAPYLVFAAYLAASVSFRAIVEQAYEFNVKYYAQFVGDVSSGLVDTFVRNVSTFFVSFSSSLVAGDLAMLISIGVLLALAGVVSSEPALAVGLATLLVASGMRGGAPQNLFLNPGGRFMVYASLVVLIGSVCLGVLAPRLARMSTWRVAAPAIAAAASVLAIAVPAFAGVKVGALVVAHAQAPVAARISDIAGEDPRIAVVNAVVSRDDYYYLGPFDFRSQLYLEGRRSSIYTFFLPWHGACAECGRELVDSLEFDRPLAIVWDADCSVWGHAVADYAPGVRLLLARDYFQIADARASDVYFLDSERATVSRRLGEAGYDTTVVGG